MNYRSKYIKYKTKYTELKKKKGGGRLITFSKTLYRVRALEDKNAPNFSFPLWFIDDPHDIYWVLMYRETQLETEFEADVEAQSKNSNLSNEQIRAQLNQSDKYSRDLTNLIVDVYDINEPTTLFSFAHNKYDDVHDYIMQNYPGLQLKKMEEYNDNHSIADDLNKYNKENIDGWYEFGEPKINDMTYIENMSEIMLLPIASAKVKRRSPETEYTVDSIILSLDDDNVEARAGP